MGKRIETFIEERKGFSVHGFVSNLTVALIVLKLAKVIASSWAMLFLPMFIMLCLEIIFIVIEIVKENRMKK